MARFDLFQIQARPQRAVTESLSMVLFAVCILLYVHAGVVRHRENPEDRVVPTLHQLTQGVRTAVLEPA